MLGDHQFILFSLTEAKCWITVKGVFCLFQGQL